MPHRERAISCRISLGSEEIELHCVHVPPGSSYGRIKIKFLEAVTKGLSTRKRPQLLVGDFNSPQVMGHKVVTWSDKFGKDGKWQLQKTCMGIAGERWDAAERSILCPRPDMEDAFRFLHPAAKAHSYVTKAKGGGNTFDHMIASRSIMPSTIRLATRVLKAGAQRSRSIGGGVASLTRRSICALWVVSGHWDALVQCPLYPRKRTHAVQLGMSAKCHKRTNSTTQRNDTKYQKLMCVWLNRGAAATR